MAISFYEKGELTSGFHGWRVVATIRGKSMGEVIHQTMVNGIIGTRRGRPNG
jgi:hypothetical protein